MANELDWYPWFFKRWPASPTVKSMTLEAKGAYIDLLTLQMQECGSIPSDFEKMLDAFGRKAPTLEYFTTVIWPQMASEWEDVTRVWEKADGRWTERAVDPVPGRKQNWDLVKIMAESLQWKKDKSEAGKKGAAVAAEKRSVAAVLAKREPALDFDFEAYLLQHYPRRADNAGWEEGVQLAREEITSQEELAAFQAAVKQYAHDNRGTKKTYIKRLHNFMKVWMDFIPKSYVPPSKRPVLALVAPAPAPARPLLPWEEECGSVGEKQLLDAFWTEKRKAAYAAGEDYQKVEG